MSRYRISEVAERSGFSPATLRYYEEIGLVPAPDRSPAGYRLYDDRALDRLSFLARAKQLGLSLEEVGELAELWDGEECGPVQSRMAGFVAAKLAEIRSRIADMAAHADRLRTVASQLAQVPEPGPCDDACACNRETVGPPAQAPVGCTLEPGDLAGRLADWEALLDKVVGREPLDGGVRLRFRPEPGLAAEVAALAQAEQTCCAFFDFAVGIGADTVTLDVRGPADVAPLIASLFG